MIMLKSHTAVAAALVAATALGGVVAKRGWHPADDFPDGARRTTSSASGPVTFGATLDRTAVLVGKESLVRVELSIAGAAQDSEVADQRVATDLIVVLDRSGSMHGTKMEHARAAIREIVSRLRPRDRFALVSYSNQAWMEIEPEAASLAARRRWESRIATLRTGGGTNLAAGLDLAVATIERARADARIPRTILISDGIANQGDASHEGLLRRARQAAQHESMLTTVGVGADFNEYLLTALADAGTGNYYYLENAQALARVFAGEFEAAAMTVASGLEVRIEPGAGVEVVDAAGYPLERQGAAVIFRPGSISAGQERRVWVSLRVPNDAPGEHDLGRFSLAYTTDGTRQVASLEDVPHVASVAGEAEFLANVDAPSWERSVIVEGFNEMKEEVARSVKAGKRDLARAAIERFRGDVGEMNAHVQSAPVAAKLQGLADLESEVDDAFTGKDQVRRQNALSKAKSLEAHDERRVGAKR